VLVAIRVDASMTIGTGHTYRMLALADALTRNSHQVVFIARALKGNLLALISEQFPILTLPAPIQLQVSNGHCQHGNWLEVSYSQEIDDCKFALSEYLQEHQYARFDWIIADNYAIDCTWHNALSELTANIMQVDDLADRIHQCDLLLDQNYYQHMHERYTRWLPTNCHCLLGPQYALLRDEFAEQRNQLPPYSIRIEQKRVVVFFGGIDIDNETEKALVGLLAANTMDHFNIIIGQNNPHKNQIMALCSVFNERVTLHIQVFNMMELFAQAYLYVGAVGATTWERCVLALPGIVCSLALNQLQLAEDLVSVNGHIYLGEHLQLTSDDYKNAYVQAVSNKQALILQSNDCKTLINGLGCQKVVNTMVEIQSNA
jgi:UDP-2,4-diacetamido-2,4,6-trideoxy-beta-L-altropyranose hydrolase